MFNRFWSWYERHHRLNLGIAAGLFIWQLVHLYWLTTDVVVSRLFGYSLFNPGDTGRFILAVVDYTEIPALITTSLVYLHDLRKAFSWKSILFLLALNSQWLHLFWITDEVVVARFAGDLVAFPLWLAWGAIIIDYFELPVIYDTIKRFTRKSG